MTNPTLPGRSDIEAAAALIRNVVAPTPHYAWPLLAERTGCNLWVKHENHTPTGAFKIRGGLVYLDWLKRTQPDVPGIIAATRGNHGQSVALAARRAGVPATIVVPEGNSREKNAAMQAFGAELIVEGADFQASLEFAIAEGARRGLHAMPSFDPRLVAGVATYAWEFLSAVPDLDIIYVPIGLGSGICGVAAAKAALGHRADIVAVVSAHAMAYADSLATGRAVSRPATTKLGDGMACRTPVADALAIMAEHVNRVVTVTDADLATAMRAYFTDTHNVAEGAGAAPLAAVLKEPERVRGRTVGVVLCGQNVDWDIYARVLQGDRSVEAA